MVYILLKSAIPLILVMVQGSYSREISSVIEGFNSNTTKINHWMKEVEPKLSRTRLAEIRRYDRMKCFPKVLCTLTKAEAFRKLGIIDLNDMADGYLRLLSAFPGGPPLTLVTKAEEDLLNFNFKHELRDYVGVSGVDDDTVGSSRFQLHDEEEGNEENAESEEEEEEEEEEEDDSEVDNAKKTRKGATTGDDEELLLTDPLLHQREKLEMKKLMDELIKEENEAAGSKKPSTWAETAMSLPLTIPVKLGNALLKSVVLPYLTSSMDRKKRDLGSEGGVKMESHGKTREIRRRDKKVSRRRSGTHRDGKSEKEAAILKAMRLWNGLKDVSQCSVLYPSCPFEAWEVVSMIKLVGDAKSENE